MHNGKKCIRRINNSTNQTTRNKFSKICGIYSNDNILWKDQLYILYTYRTVFNACYVNLFSFSKMYQRDFNNSIITYFKKKLIVHLQLLL